MLNSRTKAAAALAGALLLLAGCGQDDGVGGANAALNPVPPGGTPGQPGSAALVDVIRGTYSGSLYKIVQHYNEPARQTAPQGYALHLAIVACPQAPQSQCAQATFTTSGEAGSTTHTVYMSYLGYLNGDGGTQIHVLQQYPASKIPNFYTSKIVALELRVALQNGTQYVPAQSKTRVMDCVLSQGAYTCRSDVSDVRFVGDLRKS